MKFVIAMLLGAANAELQAWVECATAYAADNDAFLEVSMESCGAEVTAETCAAAVIAGFTPNSYNKHACVALQNGCDEENPTHNICMMYQFAAEDQADFEALLASVGDPRACGTEEGDYSAAILAFGDGAETNPSWATEIDACSDPSAVEEEEEEEEEEDEDSANALTYGLVALTATLSLM